MLKQVQHDGCGWKPALPHAHRAERRRAGADAQDLRIAERADAVQELADRDGGGGVGEVPDPAQLDERKPVRHPLGHAGGHGPGEAGIDQAGAEARLWDGAGGEGEGDN
jgi:hypothetical protein